MENFYVISVHHTLKCNRFILFWRPDDRGYTYRLSTAGKYDRERVIGHLGYYNSGCSNIAVPVEVAESLAVQTTPADMLDGPDGPAVLNTKENWRALLAAVIERPQYKAKPPALYFGRNAA